MTASLRLVHLSDTHNLHRSIPDDALPPADILLHTGDFTNHGTDAEVSDFNDWLGQIRKKFGAIVVIPGNHDVKAALDMVGSGHLDARALADQSYWKSGRLSHATHVLGHEAVTIQGLTIFGSSWDAWHSAGALETRAAGAGSVRGAVFAALGDPKRTHSFGRIPAGVDVLMTHGPADRILDRCEGHSSWGSSPALRAHIVATRPKVHCFGHLHEQRGVYAKKPNGHYAGGVEYVATRGGPPMASFGPPPAEYPCQLISNNAMSNHGGLDGMGPCLVGPPRVINASWGGDGVGWTFATPLRKQ